MIAPLKPSKSTKMIKIKSTPQIELKKDDKNTKSDKIKTKDVKADQINKIHSKTIVKINKDKKDEPKSNFKLMNIIEME